MQCPSDETLVALAEGALAPGQRAQLLEHAERCPTCAVLLGQAARFTTDEQRMLGRYHILEELGTGGMGRVYLAYDPVLERDVALKVVRAETGDPTQNSARLAREARALAAVAHPAVVAVFDVQVEADVVFVAMELLAGMTLGRWNATGPTTSEILDVFAQAGQGLQAAHAAGLIHRDFKPGNVMVCDDGRVVVLDFGLARPMSGESEGRSGAIVTGRSDTAIYEAATGTSAFAGTPLYMAPEQYCGTATAKSDQYAFCLALFEALAGEYPFSRDGPAVLARAKRERALPGDLVARIPPRLRRVLLRGLEPESERRFPDMATLLRVMIRARRRRRWPLAAAGVLTALAGVWAVSGSSGPAIDCARAGDRITAIWPGSSEAQASVAAVAEPVARHLLAALDQRSGRLGRSYVDACRLGLESQRRGLLSDVRWLCLREREHELAAVTASLRELGPEVARANLDALETLAPVGRCDDDDHLAALAKRGPMVGEEADDLRERLAKAEHVLELGRYRESLPLFEDVVAASEARGYEALAVRALGGLASNLRKLDDERTRSIARQTHIRARLLRDYQSAGRSALALMHHARRRGRLEEAEQWLQEARRDTRGTAWPKLRAHVLEGEGALAHRRNQFEKALDRHREAAEIYRGLDPDGSSFALGLWRVAQQLRRLERFDEAVATLTRAAAILRERHGDDGPPLGLVENELGTTLLIAGRAGEGVPHLERAVALTERGAGARSKSMMVTRMALAACYREAGRIREAGEQIRLALDLLADLPHGPREAAVAWFQYARTLARQGRLQDALTAYERSRGHIALMESGPARRDLMRLADAAEANILERTGELNSDA